MEHSAGHRDTTGTLPEAGRRATVRFGEGSISNRTMDERATIPNLDAAGGLRVAPLLVFPGNAVGERWAAVGHVIISAGPKGTSFEATLAAAWSENGHANEFALVDDSERREQIERMTAEHLVARARISGNPKSGRTRQHPWRRISPSSRATPSLPSGRSVTLWRPAWLNQARIRRLRSSTRTSSPRCFN